MMDFDVLKIREANLEEYIFNFVFMNIVFLFSYLFRNYRKDVTITWVLILLFCLYAYWNTDYFSFRRDFFITLADFRDPFYYYLGLVSFESYTLFRLLVWGGALWLYKKSLKRFHISLNFAVFVFAIFYLLTFSVGRISLGIAMYFYGISVLLNPYQNKFSSYFKGVLFIVCSYWGHRAMALPIVLTPIILVKPTKKYVGILVIAGFILGKLSASLLSQLIAGDVLIGSGTAAEKALLAYASNENDLVMNWKFALTSKLRWYSIYFLVGYSVWKSFFSRSETIIPLNIQRLVIVCLTVFLFAFSLLQFDTIGANEMGERFLLILGLPLTGILAFFCKENICSWRTLCFLLLPAFIYAEGFIFGKILSLL